MNLKLGLLVVVVIVVVLAGIGFAVNNLVLQSEASLSKPWVEVIVPGVFELAEDQKTEKRELQTGDEIVQGTVIGVRKGALANIYFPDGSVARLDSGTRLILEEGSFESKNNKLNVRLNLLWGRVWSKVVTVLTPESFWEVKTTNAVAAVLGSAFGVEYIEQGKSNIVGYENKVEVKLIDPETKKVLPVVAMVVEAKKILEVKKEAVENMKAHLASGDFRQAVSAVATKAGQPIMEVKEVSEKMLNQDWVKRGIEADGKLNEKMQAMREKIKDQKEAVKEFRKELQGEFRDKIEERRKEIKVAAENIKIETREKISDLKNDLQNKVLEQREAVKENLPAEDLRKSETAINQAVSPEKTAVQSAAAKPQSLAIKVRNDLTSVSQEDVLIFQAWLQFSDGSQKDVTLEANWRVIGEIGVMMKSPGVFVARLSDKVSEFGIAPGAIAASWKEAATGNILEGTSPIFKVEIKADTNFDPTRG